MSEGGEARNQIGAWLQEQAQIVHGPGAEKVAEVHRRFLAEFPIEGGEARNHEAGAVGAAVRAEAERLGYRPGEFIDDHMAIARAALDAARRSPGAVTTDAPLAPKGMRQRDFSAGWAAAIDAVGSVLRSPQGEDHEAGGKGYRLASIGVPPPDRTQAEVILENAFNMRDLADEKRVAAEAQRDAYKAALEVAADDLDKAANQFEAMRQSQEAGYTVPISINPGRFAEKAARARSVLAGGSSTTEE